LLADYQTCREEDRTLANVQVALFSVAVTLIGLMAAAVTQTCEFSGSRTCVEVPGYILAGGPLIPAAVLAYFTMVSITATLRSYYLRGLEYEIRKHASTPITSLGEVEPISYVGITIEATSLRHGLFSFRLLANLVFLVIILVFGGFTAYIGFHVGLLEQVAMSIVYGCIAILLIWVVVQGTLRGRPLFVRSAQRYLIHGAGTPLPQIRAIIPVKRAGRERPLISYLILPRPTDLIKWLIAPGVFLATAISFGNLGSWPTFVALWLILEYLIYNARYQWNDVRGIKEDRSHAEQRARGRLPVGPDPRTLRRNVMISTGVAAARLVAAVALGYALGLVRPTVTMIALVFVIAIAYELLRSVSPPSNPEQLTPVAVGIWCLVGLGYGVRAGLGFVVGGLALANGLAIIGILYFVVLGIMFVLLTWVLEATSFCQVDAKGIWRIRSAANGKAHVTPLLRYVPVTLAQGGAARAHGGGAVQPVTSGSTQPVLATRGRLQTPWNLALVLSAALGGLLGVGLAHASEKPAADVIVSALSVAGAFLVIASSSQIRRLTATGIMAILIIGSAVSFEMAPLTLLAAAPWLTIAVIYSVFRGSSYQDLTEFVQRIVLQAVVAFRAMWHIGPLLLHLIVGKETWRAGWSTPPSPGSLRGLAASLLAGLRRCS
jgi:hypothetical protein